MTLPTPHEIADAEVDVTFPKYCGECWSCTTGGAIRAYSAVAKELRKIIFNDRIYKKDYDKLLQQLEDGEKV